MDADEQAKLAAATCSECLQVGKHAPTCKRGRRAEAAKQERPRAPGTPRRNRRP